MRTPCAETPGGLLGLLHDSNELMPQHALKAHVAFNQFQVGVADACVGDADNRFAVNGRGRGVVLVEREMIG
jgi:hypothetical protein